MNEELEKAISRKKKEMLFLEDERKRFGNEYLQ